MTVQGLTFGPPFPSQAEYHRVARLVAAESTKAHAVRVAILSSYTAEFLKPFLHVELARLGLESSLWFGGFGQLESLVMDSGSALYAFRPDVVVMALRIEDIQPDAVFRARTADGAELRDAAAATIARTKALVEALQSTRRCTVLLSNFSEPEPSVLSVGDASVSTSRSSAFAGANVDLRMMAAGIGGAFVWDYAGLVRARGALEWSDARLWFHARIPVAAPHHAWMAQHLARTIRASISPMAKVLVVDLDNTIWGGVIGDDGIEGIALGDEYPGNEFKALQRQVLALRDRGVLLAVASKNDEAVVVEAFRGHPEMLLRWEDFAAARVNWLPKSIGIAEMATELNLGLDAFVFLDDNPVERTEVQSSLPSVKVIDVEPWGTLRRALASCPWFDTLSSSAEDFVRAEQYSRERERREGESRYATVDEFLRSLGMCADVGRAGAVDRGRVAQLIGKTNQFNLTGRRHPEAALGPWIDDSEHYCVARLRLRDRFGDHGMVAAALMVREAVTARIDTLVMSCRVMNRHVESGLLAYLCEVASEWGCQEIIGEYIASPRNSMVSGFYPAHGFVGSSKEGSGTTWTLALDRGGVAWPELLRRDGDTVPKRE